VITFIIFVAQGRAINGIKKCFNEQDVGEELKQFN
jgi:hypothetical protein